MTLHLPSSLSLVNLWTIIEWVLLIQIRFHKLIWVLEDEKKWLEKTHFEIFWMINCDLSTSSPISQNWNILISTHPIVKLKIVLEILGSGEDMLKNPFHILSFSPLKILVTLHLPQGRTMSPGPRRNFRNMGFHFLTPIYHFLSKPNQNAKLVAYSIKTHTWPRTPTLS